MLNATGNMSPNTFAEYEKESPEEEERKREGQRERGRKEADRETYILFILCDQMHTKHINLVYTSFILVHIE